MATAIISRSAEQENEIYISEKQLSSYSLTTEVCRDVCNVVGWLSNFVPSVSREVSYLFSFDGAGQVVDQILARCSTAKQKKHAVRREQKTDLHVARKDEEGSDVKWERGTQEGLDRGIQRGGEGKKNVKELKTEQVISLLIFLYSFLLKRDVLTEK